VRLAVGETLVLACELDELALDLLFLREHALLDLQHLLPALGDLGVDVRAELDRLLTRLDLGLAAQRFGLALRVLEQLAVDASRLADPGDAEGLHGEQREQDSDDDPCSDTDPDQHVQRTSLGWVRPIRHCARGADRRSSLWYRRARARPQTDALRRRRSTSRCGREVGSQAIREFG